MTRDQLLNEITEKVKSSFPEDVQLDDDDVQQIGEELTDLIENVDLGELPDEEA